MKDIAEKISIYYSREDKAVTLVFHNFRYRHVYRWSYDWWKG